MSDQVVGTTFADLRDTLRKLASQRDEWAGIPMLLDGVRLILEPTYPYAKRIEAIQRSESEAPQPSESKAAATDLTRRNTFWSWRYRTWVSIWEDQGKIGWAKHGMGNNAQYALASLTACDAWGIEEEANAVVLLARLVSPHQLKHYMMTGSFVERSKRSNVLYVFRRLRPTLAISMRGPDPRILCTLCMHPIGYYEDSWAGTMVPTDDVIAHLMMMRGDEHMFWRRSNQHAPWEHQAGV